MGLYVDVHVLCEDCFGEHDDVTAIAHQNEAGCVGKHNVMHALNGEKYSWNNIGKALIKQIIIFLHSDLLSTSCQT